MEIRRWQHYLIVNCVLIVVLIKYLDAKTFSLNDVIAAESRAEAFETTLPPKLTGTSAKRFSLIKSLSSKSKLNNFLKSDYTGSKKLSPLKYKKEFQIKSPLKPRRLKLGQLSRYKRKKQSAKREINGNDKLKQKYIPLLKSLSMLFDNLLNSDASESYEIKTKKFKRNKYYSEDNSPPTSDSRSFELRPQEKTVATTSSPTPKIWTVTQNPATEATPATSNTTTPRNFSTFRQNKDIPVLLPRNTLSTRRNDNGFSERSGAPLHGNTEGDITRDHGDHEHHTRFEENGSRSKSNEENTNGVTRDNASSIRYSGTRGRRNDTRISDRRTTTNKNSENEDADDNFGKDRVEAGRNETESTNPIPESIRRLRGFISEGKIGTKSESIQPEEIRKEGNINVTIDSTGDKPIPDRSGPFTEEVQTIRTRNETVTSIEQNWTTSPRSQKKSPVVMIFDGYSVTRDINGENKFLEKSIRLHS